jgi:hypothetical protein
LEHEPDPQPDGRLYYRADEYAQNGVTCQRLVVVAPSKRNESEPSTKEILTSFGEFIPDPGA